MLIISQSSGELYAMRLDLTLPQLGRVIISQDLVLISAVHAPRPGAARTPQHDRKPVINGPRSWTC
jgi:hypothetical protein